MLALFDAVGYLMQLTCLLYLMQSAILCSWLFDAVDLVALFDAVGYLMQLKYNAVDYLMQFALFDAVGYLVQLAV